MADTSTMEKVIDGILEYFSTGPQPASMVPLPDYYTYIEGNGGTVYYSDDGNVTGSSHRFQAPTGDGGIAEAEATGNSNVQSGTASSGNNMTSRAPITADILTGDDAGKANATAGARKSSDDSIVPSVITRIGQGVLATGVAGALGKTIAQGLYQSNPDFWDAHNMSTLDPTTWASITEGDDSRNAALINAILAIDPNTKNVQAYVPAQAFDYAAAYANVEGVFNTGSPSPYDQFIISGTVQYTGYIDALDLVEYAISKYGNRISANTISLIRYQVSRYVSRGYTAIIQQFPYNNNTDFSMDVFNPSIFSPSFTAGSSMPRVLRVEAYPYWSESRQPAPTYGGDGWPVFVGEEDLSATAARISGINGTTSPAVPGVDDQPGATLPSFDSGDTINQISIKIINQFPDLPDNSIYIDVPSADGSTTERIYYYPIPWPDGVDLPDNFDSPIVDNQPTFSGDGPTQAAPEITVNSPDNVINVITRSIGQDTGETNPPNTGSGTTPAVIIPDGTASALFTIYNPTQAELNSFGQWLWSSNFIDQLLKMFTNPMQAIIGLHKVYAAPIISGTGTIHVGYLDSQVGSNIVGAQYVTVSCGAIDCAEYFGNVFDYPPFTTIDLYLPFIGIVPLSPDDVMRSRIQVKYHVDVLTGACLADVKITRDGTAGGIIYQYSGNAAVQYPLSSGSYMGIISSVAATAGSAVATYLTGGAAAPLLLGSAAGIMGGAASTQVQKSGSFSGNAGAMGSKKPYLIISRPQTALADGQEQYIGQPAHKTVVIGSLSGYTKLLEVHLEGIPATGEELQEIESLLKEGVIL